MSKTKKSTALAAVYILLCLFVIASMVRQFMHRNYTNVMLCVLTLLLFMIPSFVEKRIKVKIPGTLEIIILLFIFSAEILGEIREFYITFKYWDAMLHTMNGFLMAAIGFSLIDILNNSSRVAVRLSPLFVAMVAFCFSMTIGVMWEFFEYGMDCVFKTDMQKDTVVEEVNTVNLHPDGHNIPVNVRIEQVEVNGESWPGYLDIGLKDTMGDLIVNFIGAAVYSLIGDVHIKHRKHAGFIERFTLVSANDEGEE